MKQTYILWYACDIAYVHIIFSPFAVDFGPRRIAIGSIDHKSRSDWNSSEWGNMKISAIIWIDAAADTRSVIGSNLSIWEHAYISTKILAKCQVFYCCWYCCCRDLARCEEKIINVQTYRSESIAPKSEQFSNYLLLLPMLHSMRAQMGQQHPMHNIYRIRYLL